MWISKLQALLISQGDVIVPLLLTLSIFSGLYSWHRHR